MKLFNRILLSYTAAIAISLMFLSFFVLDSIERTIRENELEATELVLNRVGDFLCEKQANSKKLVMRLYRNKEQSSDMIFFLRNSIDQYYSHRLDELYNRSSCTVQGMFTYILDCFMSDPDMEDIILYSRDHDFTFLYAADNYAGYLERNEVTTIPDGADIRTSGFDIIDAKPRKYVLGNPREDTHVYSTVVPINDPNTLRNAGYMVVNYNLAPLANYCRQFNSPKNGYILGITPTGDVFFDSSNEHYGQRFPCSSLLKSAESSAILGEECYTRMNTSACGMLLVSVVPKSRITRETRYARRTILLVASVLTAGAAALMHLRLSSYQKRTDTITSAMKQVQDGDLSIRIPVGNADDELALIAASFNDMCHDLSDYINRVYLSEIRRKNAELVALQAQINPHFLFNTLESIRMRSIAEGASDVAEMIYILATLLRDSINNDMVITVSEEINRCRLYLELFRMRYENRFTYSIDIDPMMLNHSIVKLTLQPIVENCIVHGIRLEKENNIVSIRGAIVQDFMEFSICDNGRGIEAAKLESIRRRLHGQEDSGSSFMGLVNVNERLLLMYGNESGVSVDSGENGGTCVKIRIPITEGDASHVQCDDRR